MKFELTHACLDATHCYPPGLFRSLTPGERAGGKMDITHTFVETGTIVNFRGDVLGVEEMRVLQGLVAMAAISGSGRGIKLLAEPPTDVGKQLRQGLHITGGSGNEPAAVVKCKYRQLSLEMGYDNNDFGMIRESIKRLFSVSVFVTHEGQTQGFRILSSYSSDDRAGQICVALNPRLAGAIIGGKHFVRIDMDEVRSLKKDPARLLHQRLHWINAGETRAVTLATLCSYVWPEPSKSEVERRAGALLARTKSRRETLVSKVGKFELAGDHDSASKLRDKLAKLIADSVERVVSPEAEELASRARKTNLLKSHKSKVRAAIKELVAIGWKFGEYARGKYYITRPAFLAVGDAVATTVN